jgi:hypothetical protein
MAISQSSSSRLHQELQGDKSQDLGLTDVELVVGQNDDFLSSVFFETHSIF